MNGWMAERWGLLDDKGNPTGKTMLRGERLKPGQYHLVVHIWIVDEAGRLLIQRRADDLKLMPFCINLANVTDFNIPAEGVRIYETYPDFVKWVNSDGKTNTKWYK